MTPHTLTEPTPFSLVYGYEAAQPTEVSIPTLRYDLMPEKPNHDELISDLDTVEELREPALVRIAEHQIVVIKTCRLSRSLKATGYYGRSSKTHRSLRQAS